LPVFEPREKRGRAAQRGRDGSTEFSKADEPAALFCIVIARGALDRQRRVDRLGVVTLDVLWIAPAVVNFRD